MELTAYSDLARRDSFAGWFLFPGQGAQTIGMAKDAYQEGGRAKVLFEESSDILGFDVPKLVFSATPEELAKTENCQPALLTASIALFETLCERATITVKGAMGLSLGEYTALVALEALDFSDAVRLVRCRGELMEQAVRNVESGMVSVMGLPDATVEEICQQASDCGIVVPANYNCPGQVVVSGVKRATARVMELAKEVGAKRCIPLTVSGAFHSPLMQYASDELKKLLDDILISTPKGIFINNADAAVLSDPDEIRSSLARQVCSPVRWTASCQKAVELQADNWIEVGPGRVCAGLLRRSVENVEVLSISTLSDMDATGFYRN